MIGVGFDRDASNNVIRFLVDLQYTESFLSPNYTQIARFDHNPTNSSGHNIYDEGIHVDAVNKQGGGRKYKPRYSHIPSDLGPVIQASADYLDQHATFFVDFYEGNHRPSNAPSWSP